MTDLDTFIMQDIKFRDCMGMQNLNSGGKFTFVYFRN